MSDTIRLNIQWPKGSMLPVRISPNETPKDLHQLLHFASHPSTEMIFVTQTCDDKNTIHNVQLSPNRTFSEQNVEDGAILYVVFSHKKRRTGSLSNRSNNGNLNFFSDPKDNNNITNNNNSNIFINSSDNDINEDEFGFKEAKELTEHIKRNIESLYRESLRLSDIQLNSIPLPTREQIDELIDNYNYNGIIFNFTEDDDQNALNSSDDECFSSLDSLPESYFTFIGNKAKKVSTDPLPLLWDSDTELDDQDSVFNDCSIILGSCEGNDQKLKDLKIQLPPLLFQHSSFIDEEGGEEDGDGDGDEEEGGMEEGGDGGGEEVEERTGEQSFLSQFSSVEEARHFFAKEQRTGWIW